MTAVPALFLYIASPTNAHPMHRNAGAIGGALVSTESLLVRTCPAQGARSSSPPRIRVVLHGGTRPSFAPACPCGVLSSLFATTFDENMLIRQIYCFLLLRFVSVKRPGAEKCLVLGSILVSSEYKRVRSSKLGINNPDPHLPSLLLHLAGAEMTVPQVHRRLDPRTTPPPVCGVIFAHCAQVLCPSRGGRKDWADDCI